MTNDSPNGTRRSRERAATRGKIVETALTILEQDGIASLTMRRVASEMEYTAPIVYQHFAGKDALLLELADHGYRLLVAELESVTDERDTEHRLLLAARAYVSFAGRHPHLFDVMNGTAVDAEQRRAVAEGTYQHLRGLLLAWSGDHGVDLEDDAEVCEIVWGTLSGIASIGFVGTIGNERAQYLAERALGAVLRGWKDEAAPRL